MTGDWRLDISPARRRHLRLWFASGAWLTFTILVVGGITRLTQSGLSIVDWQPIMGVLPPLDGEQWQETFRRYQQFPEYQQLRRGMSLEEFKVIFFWEYTHRLAARIVGVVFLVPFLVFWLRGYFPRPLLLRVLALFALGAMQGFMGWFMVKSGLVDRPSVSHFRLASHLTLALTILALCSWLMWELRSDARPAPSEPGERRLARWVHAIGGLLVAQIIWGAFVAGLDAGLYYNTFPLMGGGLGPPGGLVLEPAILNAIANPVVVQWIHRVLGTALLLASLAAAADAWLRGGDRVARRSSLALLLALAAQYALGVVTLVLSVPVSAGSLHQAGAVVVFVMWLRWFHHTRRSQRNPVSSDTFPAHVRPETARAVAARR